MFHKPISPDQLAGVWIDRKNAIIIRLRADEPAVFERIASATDHAPLAISEHAALDTQSKLQRHQHNEQLHYFHKIIDSLSGEDYVYLMGPANTKLELNHAIQNKAKALHFKVVGIQPSEKLSDNQLVKRVKEFFSSLTYEDSKRRLLDGVI